jgi:hypothetical protein
VGAQLVRGLILNGAPTRYREVVLTASKNQWLIQKSSMKARSEILSSSVRLILTKRIPF